MDLRQYARVLRAHWLLITVCILGSTVLAGIIAWNRAPTYAASTQLFVSNKLPADLSETYAGSLFSQQRVVSYAQLVSSAPVAEDVIEQLDLPYSVQKLQGEINATVPAGTVLINLTVNDGSPERAKAIADALASAFPAYIANLEAPQGGSNAVEISVTSRAQLPTEPIAPQKFVYLLLGLLLGLILGVGAAVLREALDRRIRTEGDAEAVAGVPLLGKLVKESRGRGPSPVVLTNPLSAPADAYRRVRTNLDASDPEPAPLSSFVALSPVASEGKTALVANLGILYAQAGHRVVLVDANLRRPELAEIMGLSSTPGLIDVMAGEVPLDEALQRTSADLSLEVLGSGSPSGNTGGLLGSRRFETVLSDLTAYADLVIFDAPALLSASEAAVLARLASGTVLVTRLASTRVDELQAGMQILRNVRADVLGIVANASKPRFRWAARGRGAQKPARRSDQQVARELLGAGTEKQR
jgi:succinoglycan biosynthesis transport protein ExoP